MYTQSTALVMKQKDDRLYIRMSSDIKEDLRILSEHVGLSMSSFIHSLVVKTISQEREKNPNLFQKKSNGILAGDLNLPKKVPKDKTGTADDD